MNCNSTQPLISKLIDGEADPREEKDARAHLDGCGACRARYEEQKKVAGLMAQSLAGHPFTKEFAARTLNLIPSRRLIAVPARKPRRILPWIAAAAAIVLIALGLTFTFTGDPETVTPEATVATVTETLEIGANKLKDGSLIDLWARSDGEVRYGEKETIVTLNSGSLYAKVEKQAESRTFKVVTKDLTVIVVGTEFYVEIKDSGTVCTVKEGKVRCVPTGRNKTLHPVSAGHAFDTSKPDKVGPVAAFPRPGMSSAKPLPDPIDTTDPIEDTADPVPDAPDSTQTGDHPNPDMPIKNPNKKDK